MNKLKKLFLIKFIALIDWGLSFKDGADNQTEVNDVVQIKNHLIKELDYLKKEIK